MSATPFTTAPRTAERSVSKFQPADPLLTTEQAAEKLTVAPKTLIAWRCTNRQRLPFVKVGGRVRYRLSDLDAFIAARVHCAAEA